MFKIIFLFMMALSFNFNVIHYHYHFNKEGTQQVKHYSGNKHEWDWYQKKKCWWKCGFEICHSYGIAFDCKGDDENRKFEACEKSCKAQVENKGSQTTVQIKTPATTTTATSGTHTH